MADKIRTCVACVHFELDLGETGYSEVTPGGPGYVECNRGHYYESNRVIVTTDDFRTCIKRGWKCEDFERHEAFKSPEGE